MADSLNWGIIGCGNVVEKKSGPSLLMAGHSRIVAVMRRDVAKARPFAEAHRIPLCTADAAEVIGHPGVDIVYIATPPASHKEYVLAAARGGKHVLVEKPMGLSAAEDTEMIDACQQAGVELFVAYYRRFHPHVLKMKELVDSGRIGYPVMAQIDFAQPPIPGYDWGWRVRPETSGGGLFVDVVTHRIDLMVYLLGKPETVYGLDAVFDSASRVEEAAALAVKDAFRTAMFKPEVQQGTKSLIDAARELLPGAGAGYGRVASHAPHGPEKDKNDQSCIVFDEPDTGPCRDVLNWMVYRHELQHHNDSYAEPVNKDPVLEEARRQIAGYQAAIDAGDEFLDACKRRWGVTIEDQLDKMANGSPNRLAALYAEYGME